MEIEELQQTIEQQPKKKPEKDQVDQKVCLIVIGMAGSGKTTFMKQLSDRHLYKFPNDLPSFLINLDPACAQLPYTPRIDIRDKYNYRDVMKTYKLGPNGAIMTSLNLFSSQMLKTVEEIEAKKHKKQWILVDTPGQIEVFTWSASGQIITTSLATTLPTILVYVVDLARCVDPNTFMSNMLFACSILYKNKLPMIVVFNKSDIGDEKKIMSWLKNFDTLLEEIDKDKSYLSSLSRSLCLVLDEFYQNLNAVAVSSLTGAGFDNFFTAVDKAKDEYFNVFYEEIQKNINKYKEEKQELLKQQELFKQQMKKQMEVQKLSNKFKKTTINTNTDESNNNNNGEVKKEKKQKKQKKKDVVIQEEEEEINLDKQ